MYREAVRVQSLNVKNCFIYLPSTRCARFERQENFYWKIIDSKDRTYYFSSVTLTVPGLEDGCIGLSSAYANLLDLKEGEIVILSSVSLISPVQDITVSPLTPDDYEILSDCKGVVEQNLLNQLKVVWPKQVFPVWISPSLSITLVVESYHPDLPCGVLLENIDVVVLTEPSNPLRTNFAERKTSSSSQDTVALSASSELRDYSQFSKNTLICRCAVFSHSDSFALSENELLRYKKHPYTVFISRNKLDKWAQSLLDGNDSSFWEMSLFDQTEEEADKKKITVQMVELSHNLIARDVGNFKTLYVSSCVKSFFKLDNGTKVTLKVINKPTKKNVSALLVTSWNESMQESELKEKLKQELISTTFNLGSILANSKAPFPLCDNELVLLTLRPLDIEWGLITYSSLKDFSISVNSFKSDSEKALVQLSDIKEPDNIIRSVDEIIKTCILKTEVSLNLLVKFNYNTFPRQPFLDNILIYGKSGSGKSIIVDALMARLRKYPNFIYTYKLDCKKLKAKRVEVLGKILIEACSLCEKNQPSVLFLEDIDFIGHAPRPNHENTEASIHLTRTSQKLVEVIESYQKEDSILVIGTADSAEEISPILFSPRGKTLFTSKMMIPELSLSDRMEFLSKIIISRSPGTEKTMDQLDLNSFASKTEGFVALDLVKFIERALFEAWQEITHQEDSVRVTKRGLEEALKMSTPVSWQGVKLFKGSKHTWSDVGGLKEVKEKLTEVILWPSMYPEILGQCPLKAQTSLLLYGAPGTGKTLVASAIAGESKLNFISVKGPELMSKFIGESEEGVRKIFQRAQEAKPCLLFFDEFDSLAPRRGKDQTGVTDRVVNQLLTALDGVEPITGVFVLAATSRPDIIDPALLRPGRIGTSAYCPLPDKDERLSILEALCSQIPLGPDVDLSVIAEETEGYSGADLKGILTSAQIRVLDTFMEFNFDEGIGMKWKNDNEVEKPKILLAQNDLMEALRDSSPSLNLKERNRYETIYFNFRNPSPPDMSSLKVTFA